MNNIMNIDELPWPSPSFRQNMVGKIDDAIRASGAPTTKSAIEMENQVFTKAQTREDYMNFVAKLILHIKDMGQKKMGGQGGMNMQQNQQNLGQGQMNIPGGSGQMSGMMPINPSMVQMQQGMGQNQMIQGMPPPQQMNQQLQQQMSQLQQQQQMNQQQMNQQQINQQQINQQQLTQQQLNQQQQQQQMGQMSGQQLGTQQQLNPQLNQQLGQPQMNTTPQGTMMGQNFIQQQQFQQQQQQQQQQNQMQLQMQQQQKQLQQAQLQQQQAQLQHQQQMQQQQQIQMQQQQLQQQQSMLQQQQQQQQLQNVQMQQGMQNPQMQGSQQQNEMQNLHGALQGPQMIQGGQMNPQIQGQQMINAQIPGQNSQMIGPGIMTPPNANSPQMMARMGTPNMSRLLAPQQTPMANQLSQMAKQRPHRPMGPVATGRSPEPVYLMNHRFYYQNGMSQADSGGMVQSFPTGGPMQRPMGPGNQFIVPTSTQSIPIVPSPGPGPQIQQGSQSQQFVPSHVGSGMMPSPASQMRMASGLGVPSPGTSINTPHMSVATPSPRNASAEEQACLEKIKELRKYTDLLQKMIAKLGNDDVEKSSKMKKLLEILTNPNQRATMEILLKCEIALKRMEKQQNEGALGPIIVPAPVTTQGTDPSSLESRMESLMESINATLKNTSTANNTFMRTFRPTVEALAGHPYLNRNGSYLCEEEDECEVSNKRSRGNLLSLSVIKRELRYLDNRFTIKMKKPDGNGNIQLNCTIADERLPSVPPLAIEVPPEYPNETPTIHHLTKEYSSTPYLSMVAQGLKARMSNLPEKFTVNEILTNWEMSVRQATNPNPKGLNFDTHIITRGFENLC